MSAETHDEPPWSGPWADDARRLFQLLQSAAEQAPGADDDGAGYQHPPECRYCPFCQGVTLLRRAGPDVLDQVSAFAAGLAATLRASAPDPGASPAGPPSDPEPGTPSGPGSGGSSERPDPGRTSAAARPPSTVRIDVTD
jgi:hypothetical protein